MSGRSGHLKREIGLIGLTFVGVGGVFGSGWLFAPLLAAQEAGAASILAWPIGALIMMLLALTFAEVSGMLPVAGGIATIPLLSHGSAVSMVVGWTAWVAYNIAAPLEVEVMLRYLEPLFPWLYAAQGKGELTTEGAFVAVALLALTVVLNAFGVRFFTRLNSTITWAKIAIPLVVAGTLMATQFSTGNFTGGGGFAPYGVAGVFAALSSGGVILSFLGFRHIIDLAGEVRRPQVMIPLALVLTLAVCLLLYFLLQVAFVGAVTPAELAQGWGKLHFSSDFGPLGAIAAALGLMWLVSLLNVSAVISPFGGTLIQMGGNARLALAMAYNGFLPRAFRELSLAGVPMRAHFLNLSIGCVIFFVLPFKEMAALTTTALIFSFTMGPIALASLRKEAPGMKRSFRLPAPVPVSAAAFFVATLIVFWSGWDTVWRLALVIGAGLPFIAYRLARLPRGQRDLGAAAWLVPYVAGVLLISWLGGFGGGIGVLGFGWDFLAIGLFSTAIFAVALAGRLQGDRFAAALGEVKTDMKLEGGETPDAREAP